MQDRTTSHQWLNQRIPKMIIFEIKFIGIGKQQRKI